MMEILNQEMDVVRLAAKYSLVISVLPLEHVSLEFVEMGLEPLELKSVMMATQYLVMVVVQLVGMKCVVMVY